MFGYSSAIVTSLVFGHVSVTFLVLPPLLFTTLHEIVIRQEHSVRRDGLVLAALLVAQFLISPEVLVICLVFAVVGLAAVAVFGWRQVRVRSGHALPALGLALGVSVVLLAYPVWFGLAGPQAVTGVLFALAPISGVPFSGVLSPGQYTAFAPEYVRFGGYLGRNGPPPDYVGGGVAALTVAAVVVARRRALTWLLVLLTAVTLWLALGGYLLSAPSWLGHPWLPWRAALDAPAVQGDLAGSVRPPPHALRRLPARRGSRRALRRPSPPWLVHGADRRGIVAAATAVVAVVAVVPVFVTFDPPFTVVPVRLPAYLSEEAPALSPDTVLLTVPFAVSGSAEPMLWQAVDDLHFRLAGAALKTPDVFGGPVGQGTPGSARRILSDLSVSGGAAPVGTPAEIAAVRRALRAWQVQEVVIAGNSRDPVYASGFFTMVMGSAPEYVDGAWVWTVPRGGPSSTPALGAPLSQCRAAAAAPGNRSDPLAMSRCVLFTAGRP